MGPSAQLQMANKQDKTWSYTYSDIYWMPIMGQALVQDNKHIYQWEK